MSVPAHVPAAVHVSGPPNSNFLVGYPGISATLVHLLAIAAAASMSAKIC